MKKLLFFSLAFIFVFALAVSVSAQDVDTTAIPVLISVDPEIEPVIDDALEGMEIEAPTKIPSNWGLWWRSIGERVSLWFTFDPLDKAEKQLFYAEERLKLAEYIAENADSEKVQEKARQMIEKAEGFVNSIEEKKDKWLDKASEKAQRLVKNMATHQVRKEKILDRLEEDAIEEEGGDGEDEAGEVIEFRQRGLENSQRLINALSNEDIPEDVKEKLEDIKSFIEGHLTEVKDYVGERQQIQQRVKEGVDNAREELRQLHQERLEAIQERVRERVHQEGNDDVNEENDEEDDDNQVQSQNQFQQGQSVGDAIGLFPQQQKKIQTQTRSPQAVE